MLVLSRRPNEEIVFPAIGIRVRLLGFKGHVARLGVEAPPQTEVLRGELLPRGNDVRQPPRNTALHALRNQLSKVSLGLHYFQQQRQAGQLVEAEQTLERVLSVLDELERTWQAARGTRHVPAAPQRLRALLVEDDANERELLAGILSMNGCQCEQAADGQAALDYLGSHEEPPDLVLLDMNLPRVSGVQALGRIRQEPRWRDVKVFAVSGADPAELGVPVGAGGVDGWFSKPLNPHRLWEAIRQTSRQRSETN